ncbi:DUF87 domain-containing protein [Salinisphaera sp. T31B1]|uniref:ATP-binding protein n=1 Tax=Salinisphaera sp. T31B1 TaxID=727963 RepID=UPI0033420DF3
MQDYEKLGAFYLGRTLADDEQAAATVLYDSADLTTHAVIIGMTGSGKTGLGVSLIEEAALDSVPVIAIDPKGDLGNLMLSFPDLAAADFEPWVDARVAAGQGMSPTDYARDQAQRWQAGLAEWGQDGERIRRLRQAAAFGIFTPGSRAGTPLSVLGSFEAPPAMLRGDREAFADRIQATATSILTLLGVDADPITSRAHVLIANLLQHHWEAGRSLDLAGLIAAVQNPPMRRIGVMDVDAIYPQADRFALAMQMNNLLASPGFAAWTEGVPLSAQGLLYTATGKPRVSIVSIAHLSDSQRMFFVTLLLSELIAWMRTQPGTGSLRAILYMDELFGYMPPTANPPSKALFLTLLKQARAFGLGVVLSTQNPMDLDYKGLSNTGTWFIGRLQTERDQARVLDGLAGAGDGGGPFDRQRMSRVLSGLGKRTFLLHNVHESQPVVFASRWAMSYLAGPLTREQIQRLTAALSPPLSTETLRPAGPSAAPASGRAHPDVADAGRGPPVLAPGIDALYAPASSVSGTALIYYPRIVGAAQVFYINKTFKVDTQRTFLLGVEIDDGPLALDWPQAEPLAMTLADLAARPCPGAGFADLAAPAHDPANYRHWASAFKTWLRQSCGLTLYRSRDYRLTSSADESEAEFRVRVHQVARQARDQAVGKLRDRYDRQLADLQTRLAAAEAEIAAETAQTNQKTVESVVSIGSALLGAFLGRKAVSATNARRIGTAARGVGAIAQQRRDLAEARADAADIRARIEAAGQDFDAEVAALAPLPGPEGLALETVIVRAKSSDITVQAVALLWLPHVRAPDGRMRPDWPQT